MSSPKPIFVELAPRQDKDKLFGNIYGKTTENSECQLCKEKYVQNIKYEKKNISQKK